MDQKNGKVKYRIGIFSGAILLFLAGLSDLVELIADIAGLGIAGWAVDAIEFALITPIFFVNKVNVLGSRYAGKWLATVVVGLIPIVSPILPETLIGVATIIIASRIDDKNGTDLLGKLPGKPKGKITRAKRVRPKVRA